MATKVAGILAAGLVSLVAMPALASSGAAGTDASEAESYSLSDPPTEPERESGWHFAVTPYLWMAGESGHVELAEGERVEIDTPFTDILGDLELAGMMAFEARYRRLVLLGDIFYLAVGSESEGPVGFVEAEVDETNFFGTFAAGYRVVDRGPLFLDLFAGGRISSLDVEVDLIGPQQSIEREKSKSSIAPVAGARFGAPLGGNWGLDLYSDLGGFGATADMSWQVKGTIHYDLSDHWRMSAGWRHVSIEHDKASFDIELSLSGPIMSFSYRF